MTYTTRSASQAVSRANATTRWTTGMCLQFVFHCLTDVSAGLPDANAAWNAARQKETTGTPPAGAPVYFKGGEHGHIALSLGGGRIRSTDWRQGYGYSPTAKGTLAPVGTATINDVAVDFFGSVYAYRGWSRDYAGQIIRGLEETNTNYSPPPVIAPTGGFLMALTDKQQTDLYNRIMAGIPDGKSSGRNNPDGSNARVLDSADGDYLRRKLVALEAQVAAIKKKLGA